MPAVVATLAGWFIIYFLDASVVHRIMLKGVEAPHLLESATAYQEVMRENGIKILSERKNFQKGQVSFVIRADAEFDRDALEEAFKDIPAKLQGALDWESN